MIIDTLKEISQLHNIVESAELGMKNFKKYIFSKYYLPIVLLRDIHEENLTLNDADEEESMLVNIKVNINIKGFE